MTLDNGTTNFITAMDIFLTAVAASAVLDAPTKTAATTLKTVLRFTFLLI